MARKPAKLHIEMIGSGEIPPDAALLMRSILLQRSPHTHLITEARSSLQNASVLVWLLGDTRHMREDARVMFRRVGPPDDNEEDASWKSQGGTGSELFPEGDLEEGDYAQVLQYINEYLPVKELVGKAIDWQTLRQFGLVDNEKRDLFLACAFAGDKNPGNLSQAPSEKSQGKALSDVPPSEQ